MKYFGLSILLILLNSCVTTTYNPSVLYYGQSAEITLDKATEKKLNNSAKIRVEVYWRKVTEGELKKETLVKVYEKVYGIDDKEINKIGNKIKINIQMGNNWDDDIVDEMFNYRGYKGYFEEPFRIKIYLIEEKLISESNDIEVACFDMF